MELLAHPRLSHRPHLEERLLAKVRILRQLLQEGARPVAIAEHHHAAIDACKSVAVVTSVV